MSVYKSEKADYLYRAFDSIWTSQSMRPKEIILIKDGPLGEELEKVVEEWKSLLDDKLKIIANEKNLGLTKSLNKGLAIVDADLIARMDTDDVSLPNRFERQVTFLEAHPEIDIVGGAVEMVDINGNLKYIRFFPEDHEQALKVISKKSPLPHPGVMMRTSSLREKNIHYDERYRNSQDIALWFDVVAAGCRIANVNEPVLRFTEADDVYTRRGKVRAKNEYLAFSRGITKLFGKWSPKHFYPLIRYIVRCMPEGFIKLMYNSRLYKSSYGK